MTQLLYNITCSVSHDIKNDWTKWMIEVHIPEVMATGMFESYMMQRIVGGEHETGVSFAIQYLSKSAEHYEQYQNKYATALQKDHKDKFGDQVVAFRTLMELLAKG